MKNYELRTINNGLWAAKILCVLSIVCGFTFSSSAQSTDQNFPTPVTSSEINGKIKARDLGDARLTSYFYAFNGNQGDIFINVVTKNLDGDIDIFTADNLRPLTKITVFSDNPDSETGRVVYLRQPQKLILRVEGRTPNDDPASFRIKFAGSFQSLNGVAETEETKPPEVKTNEETDVRVNSVGTILEVKPKPTPTPRATIAKVEKEKNKNEEPVKETKNGGNGDEVKKEEDKKPEVSVTENLPEKKEETEDQPVETTKPKKTSATRTVRPKQPRTTAKTETKPKTPPERKPEITPVDPSQLENIRLVVEFKDGRKIERPMSEVLRFGVDKGILTIIAKDGSIGRYSILDITKITIE